MKLVLQIAVGILLAIFTLEVLNSYAEQERRKQACAMVTQSLGFSLGCQK
jgi:hypothetical protein